MVDTEAFSARIGQALRESGWAKAGELLLVFLIPLALILLLSPLTGGNPITSQTIAWVANVLMLALIFLGLRARGETFGHFGLSLGRFGIQPALRLLGLSLLALLLGLAAFVLGAIVAVNIAGMPEGADMTGYNYLEGNLPLLLVALPAVYFASSWGEEVVYRGFLINRLAELSGGKWRWHAAVLVSGLVFGLAHFAWGFVGIVETAFMGFALGAAYLRFGRNLWVTVLAHGVMDTVLFVQMYLGQPSI